MADIHIILDSTASITNTYLKKYANLHIIPLNIIIDKSQWYEEQLTPDEMFKIVASGGGHPKTSQPAVGDFLAVIDPLLRADKEIIIITLSGGLSGTAQGARLAATMANSNKIQVIDSETTAVGMVKLAEAALTMADKGKSAQAIVRYLQTQIRATHTMFIPDTLDYLHKGGRIGGAAALFGSILQIKPILQLLDGRVAVLDKVRTMPKAISRMLDELKRYNQLEYIGVVHCGALNQAEALSRQIRELYPYTDISVSSIGSVLGAHLGPGVVGLIFQERI
ncbi:DegV family protein [Dendrosporobacter sp. 1207_IL3150]|uniref:DegV family protein n=1 Tax=Dendrosporobacter sp. 1207_IL3150 TaxID=3084054 RepID=UPI002FDAA762